MSKIIIGFLSGFLAVTIAFIDHSITGEWTSYYSIVIMGGIIYLILKDELIKEK